MLKNLLKDILQEYKPFLLFLAKFFICYLVLTLVYQYYLGKFEHKNNQIDTFTISVGKQTIGVLRLFEENSYSINHLTEPSVKIYYKNKYVSRIIEGCNAISVMILFISFVVAFTGRFKSTVWFILMGLILIHVLNITRIALLSVALFKFPQYEHFLHGVLFPLIIYGVVFLLWVIWVNKFSLYAKQVKK